MWQVVLIFFKAPPESSEAPRDFKTYFDTEFRKTFPEAEALLEIFQHLPASWMEPVFWALGRLYKDIQMERLAPLFAVDLHAPLNLGPSLQMALISSLGITEIRYQRLLTTWITTHMPSKPAIDTVLPAERVAKEEPKPLKRLEALNRPMADLIACLLLRGRIPQLGSKNLEKAEAFLEKAAQDPKLAKICDYLRRNPKCEVRPLECPDTETSFWNFSNAVSDVSVTGYLQAQFSPSI